MNKPETLTLTIFGEIEIKNDKITPSFDGVFLKGSKNLEKLIYLEKEGLPNKEGIVLMDAMLTRSLAANIHLAHQQGIYDSAEHFRKIISDLEILFVQNIDVRVGKL